MACRGSKPMACKGASRGGEQLQSIRI